MSSAETFARWVFDQLADGGDCPEDGMIDKLEELGLVESKSHAGDGMPGVSVSLFWKEPTPQLGERDVLVARAIKETVLACKVAEGYGETGLSLWAINYLALKDAILAGEKENERS